MSSPRLFVYEQTVDSLLSACEPQLLRDRWLLPAERERCDRFVYARDQRLYLAAHSMLRTLIGRHIGADAAMTEFRTGPHGKPYLDGSWQFSLSHTRDAVLIGIGEHPCFGVDIEASSRPTDLMLVARRSFAKHEYETVSRAGSAEKERELFFCYWTLKESYIKAIGTGLATSLQSFSFSLTTPPQVTVEPSTEPSSDWHFEQWQSPGPYTCAVGARGPAPTIARMAFDPTWFL